MERSRSEVITATLKFTQTIDNNILFTLIKTTMPMYTMAYRLLRSQKDSSPGGQPAMANLNPPIVFFASGDAPCCTRRPGSFPFGAARDGNDRCDTRRASRRHRVARANRRAQLSADPRT